MNAFGRLFKVEIFGESHGDCVGILIDGCPAGIKIGADDFREDLDRRMPGLPGTTARRESDIPEIKSGVFDGHTTGVPILIEFGNNDTRSGDYVEIRKTPRPGHADFVSSIKYGGYNDSRGSGHFSGRLTAGIVAAGVIAKKIIGPIQPKAVILEAGGKKDYRKAAEETAEKGDSIGGLIECRVSDVPAGLGEPFFDSAESIISHIIFAIPAIKGIEFGSGFGAARMSGSGHNDNILSADGRTERNNAGGINGGITNGNELVFRVAVKPPSSISLPQKTINLETGLIEELVIEGRHDACIALRMPVIIEAATAIALADMILLEQKVPRIIE